MSRTQDPQDLPSSAETPSHPPGAFATTHWSVVVQAGQSDTPHARDALEQLCRVYWYPLYAYVRRRGYPPPDAQDLTQEFFLRLLERNWLARADQAKGRFRSFLLSALERFLANEWDKARALKRGGGHTFLSLPLESGEARYQEEPADPRTPEQAFERRWALALLEQVLDQMEAECRAQGKAPLFAALRPCLLGDGHALPYHQAAKQLGMTENAVKITVHRLRQHYRELLQKEIAHTVASPGEVELEMRHLFTVISGREI